MSYLDAQLDAAKYYSPNTQRILQLRLKFYIVHDVLMAGWAPEISECRCWKTNKTWQQLCVICYSEITGTEDKTTYNFWWAMLQQIRDFQPLTLEMRIAQLLWIHLGFINSSQKLICVHQFVMKLNSGSDMFHRFKWNFFCMCDDFGSVCE